MSPSTLRIWQIHIPPHRQINKTKPDGQFRMVGLHVISRTVSFAPFGRSAATRCSDHLQNSASANRISYPHFVQRTTPFSQSTAIARGSSAPHAAHRKSFARRRPHSSKTARTYSTVSRSSDTRTHRLESSSTTNNWLFCGRIFGLNPSPGIRPLKPPVHTTCTL